MVPALIVTTPWSASPEPWRRRAMTLTSTLEATLPGSGRASVTTSAKSPAAIEDPAGSPAIE